MVILRSEMLCAAALVGVATASVADIVGKGTQDPTLTATFGGMEGDLPDGLRGGRAMGHLSFQLGGKPGYTAVNWTTSHITIPKALVADICGSSSGGATFSYSVNEKWQNPDGQTWAQGEQQCGAAFIGGRWDPTAACSGYSANGACKVCDTADGYKCSAGTFNPRPDASGSFAYRFLNEHACELGDLSGMHGELEVAGEDGLWLSLRNLAGEDAGLAQMSTPFGVVSRESVDGESAIGLNCDASGPPAVHGTNCKCIRFNGEKSESVGTLTIFRPLDHETFYMGGAGLEALKGRSVSVQCGSSFGDKEGTPLFCAALEGGSLGRP